MLWVHLFNEHVITEMVVHVMTDLSWIWVYMSWIWVYLSLQVQIYMSLSIKVYMPLDGHVITVECTCHCVILCICPNLFGCTLWIWVNMS
jgi:hypothetical protein